MSVTLCILYVTTSTHCEPMSHHLSMMCTIWCTRGAFSDDEIMSRHDVVMAWHDIITYERKTKGNCARAWQCSGVFVLNYEYPYKCNLLYKEQNSQTLTSSKCSCGTTVGHRYFMYGSIRRTVIIRYSRHVAYCKSTNISVRLILAFLAFFLRSLN